MSTNDKLKSDYDKLQLEFEQYKRSVEGVKTEMLNARKAFKRLYERYNSLIKLIEQRYGKTVISDIALELILDINLL